MNTNYKNHRAILKSIARRVMLERLSLMFGKDLLISRKPAQQNAEYGTRAPVFKIEKDKTDE